ncbi:Exocyst complex component S5 [Binucleata daphniae]
MNELKNKDFDTKKYICTNFKNSNVNDLNDFMTFLNKSLQSHKVEEKNLVSKHFGKFIECRSVVETIKNHMANETRLGKINTTSLKNFTKIEIEEYDAYKKKDEIKQKFNNLFTLNEQLCDTTSFDMFVNACLKAYKELQECKESKYLQFLFDNTEETRKEMLNKICCEIEKKEQNVDDVMHFFDLYFKLEAINKKSLDENILLVSHFTSKNKQKMENTILVNTKYKIEDIFTKNDILISIDNVKPIIYKLIEYDLSIEIKDELLNTFVQHITRKLDVEKYDKMLYSLITKEMNNFVVFIAKNVTTSEKYKFINKTNQIKNKMAENVLYTLLEYKNTIACFCNEFIEKIQECQIIKNNIKDEYISDKIKTVLNDKLTSACDLDEIYHLKNIFINKLKDITESELSEMEEYYTLLREYEQKRLKKVIGTYQDELYNISIKDYKNKNNEEVQEIIIPAMMMKIYKIINKYPKSYKIIINELYHSLNNNVCKYFMKDLCKQKIELNDDERILFYKYNKAYGMFLINNEAEKAKKEQKPKIKKLTQTEDYDKEERYRIDEKNNCKETKQ